VPGKKAHGHRGVNYEGGSFWYKSSSTFDFAELLPVLGTPWQKGALFGGATAMPTQHRPVT
jgi:hypothetical protein